MTDTESSTAQTSAAPSAAVMDLRTVENPRTFPTRATQRLQVAIQNRVIRRVFGGSKPLALPWPLKLLRRWPYFRRFPARVIGMGFRPEHVKS